MVDLEFIKRALDDEKILDDTYATAFQDLNVFVNYTLSLIGDTKYQTRQNRILMVYDDVEWLKGETIEVTSIVKDDFVQYSQFKLNNSFTVRVGGDGELIALTPKAVTGIEKRQAWDEKFETMQYYLINLQNMRDALIDYLEEKKQNILDERIRNYGSLEVYNSIQKCRKKIDDIECEICFLEEQDVAYEVEIYALIQQKNKLEKYVEIALNECITVEDVVKRCFNISNIRSKSGIGNIYTN